MSLKYSIAVSFDFTYHDILLLFLYTETGKLGLALCILAILQHERNFTVLLYLV